MRVDLHPMPVKLSQDIGRNQNFRGNAEIFQLAECISVPGLVGIHLAGNAGGVLEAG
ncbi:hypothetical protein [Microbispora sp. ATCC PTA-5024]|uniref:hypothetical protein n=1 Tax=Microbispora sp. ATCC PTA-5024 TaxID=316330 RepID=UPI0012ECDC79|nr:hypothetical protein [Microbispora sp. ATCC PTA-5024]